MTGSAEKKKVQVQKMVFFANFSSRSNLPVLKNQHYEILTYYLDSNIDRCCQQERTRATSSMKLACNRCHSLWLKYHYYYTFFKYLGVELHRNFFSFTIFFTQTILFSFFSPMFFYFTIRVFFIFSCLFLFHISTITFQPSTRLVKPHTHI